MSVSSGSASFAWRLKPGGAIGLMGDITAAHAGYVSSSGYEFTFSTYTATADNPLHITGSLEDYSPTTVVKSVRAFNATDLCVITAAFSVL